FAKHDYGAVAVFIANEIRAAVTVTFFAAENVKRRVSKTKPPRLLFGEMGIILTQLFRDRALVLTQFFADVFKTGQRFDAAQTVKIGDGLLQIGGNESLNDHGAGSVLFIQDALVEQCLDSIPGKERAGLISSQQFHFATLCANCRSHAIAFWVRRDDQVRIFLLSKI